jgi:hypothetical protein
LDFAFSGERLKEVACPVGMGGVPLTVKGIYPIIKAFHAVCWVRGGLDWGIRSVHEKGFFAMIFKECLDREASVPTF